MSQSTVYRSLIFILLMVFNTSAFAWWNCAWTRRVPITVNNTSATALTNYEIELKVNAANFPGYTFANLDKDFRAIDSDDITALNFFVEPRAPAGTLATAWVRIPALAAGASKTFYIYYNNAAATSTSNAVNTFSQNGIRMWTRNSTADPTSRATAEASFAAATAAANYGCKILTDFTSISNANQFGANSNIAYMYTGAFNLAATGNWGFRYGADLGRGGGMYMDDGILEEDWNVNMWWAGVYTNAAQILSNAAYAITATGYHMWRIEGFEDCCDGNGQIQFKTPTGAFTTWTNAALPALAPQCPVVGVTTSIGANATISPAFSFGKTVVPFSDPFNNTTNPKYIPGARARYTLSISNSGASSDAGTVLLSDPIPANTKLYVGNLGGTPNGPVIFTQGATSSTLTYSFVALNNAGDSLSFSNNGGVSYVYGPVADADGYDTAVTNIRISTGGTFACGTTAAPTSVSYQFDVGVQ